MATKNVELESGCFARAEPDEPMFVLLGRDRLAPWLVLVWSWLRRCQIYIGFKPASDFERCDEAAELARQMRAWRKNRRPTLAESSSEPICDCQCPPGRVKNFAAISVDCPIHGDGA